MLDHFVWLAPILLLPVVALLGFVGCAAVLGLNDFAYAPALTWLGSASASASGAGSVTLILGDTSQANLLVLVVADLELQPGASSSGDQIVDSINGSSAFSLVQGITFSGASVVNSIAMFYCKNAKGARSGHTITVSGGSLTACAVLWAQGADTIAPLDTFNIGQTLNGPSLTLPAINPAGSGELIVTGVSADVSSFTVDTGFTVPNNGQQPFHGGGNAGVAIAYLVQSQGNPVGPTWTGQPPSTAATVPLVAVIAAFK